MTNDDRATINMPRDNKEEFIDKAVPRVVSRLGALLSQQEALIEVYKEWWLFENARELFPEEVATLVQKVREKRPHMSDQLPWSLPSADLSKRKG